MYNLSACLDICNLGKLHQVLALNYLEQQISGFVMPTHMTGKCIKKALLMAPLWQNAHIKEFQISLSYIWRDIFLLVYL